MYLPPANQDPNQPNPIRYDNIGQQVPIENHEAWKTCITLVKEEHRNFFSWLLSLFQLGSHGYQKDQTKALEEAIKNPKSFFEALYELHEKCTQLENTNKALESQICSLKNSNWSFSGNNSYLNQENQRLTKELYRLQQENSRNTQLHLTIEELEKENKELHGRVSSLMSKLSDRDRDKTSTITSNDSRRQRDILTQEFIQINNQYFNATSIEVFNYQRGASSDLNANRKREIARIKSTLSKMIFIEGRKLFTRSVPLLEGDFTQAIQLFANKLLKDLGMPERVNCPESIIKILEKLVEEGLRLVKDIVNDEPPGEFLIENEGTIFNSERHEPVQGCQPSGKILYTTYPGYCVNNRIFGDALKAFVFTVPEEEFDSAKTSSNIENKEVASENDSDSNSNNIESAQSVETNCSSVADTLTGSQEQEIDIMQKLEALQKTGLSEVEIAKRLDTSSQSVYNWITGKHNPLKDNAEKIDVLYKEVCGGDCNR